jgi:hypothetical protein
LAKHPVDIEICDIKIKGLLNCGMKEQAKETLLQDLKKNSIVPTAQVYRTFIRLYLRMVQENKSMAPDISTIKALKRVFSSLEGVEKLENEETTRLNSLIKSL